MVEAACDIDSKVEQSGSKSLVLFHGGEFGETFYFFLLILHRYFVRITIRGSGLILFSLMIKKFNETFNLDAHAER